MKRVAFISWIVLMFWRCTENKSPNQFSDPVLVTIAELQDRRQSDSLSQYLKSASAKHRFAAALAFGSVQDTTVSPLLGNLLLEDPNAEVRRVAAFALGQTGGIAAVNALIPAIHAQEARTAKEVLEALGKTITRQDEQLLINYKAGDSLRQEGLALAYYRLGLRNLADTTIMRRESEFLNASYSIGTRLAAAHFFSRAKMTDVALERRLIAAALHDPIPEVRMAATSGLKNLDPQHSLSVLQEILQKDKDYRVRNSVVRACVNYSMTASQDIVFGALRDSSIAVQISASELILKLAKECPVKRIEDEIDAANHDRVRANLYGARLSSVPNDKTVQDILTRYENSTDYAKAYLLTALGHTTGKNQALALGFLSSVVTKSNVLVIKSTAAMALVSLNEHKDFYNMKRQEFADLYKKVIALGDPAVIGIVAGALGDPLLDYKSVINDPTFLKVAMKKLKIPKDIESMQPLADAIAYLEGKGKPTPLKNNFNHPMDWNLIKSIPRAQTVLIRTLRGDIIVRLFVEETPGTVGNFVNLIDKGYFDGKFFHRVVPNFVIQTGCNRGDGFGSEDYSIRSEFSERRYGTGAVGMASAGKDTEGTQWFITHSPTPHLDGRYTLFAEVVKGQEVVDQVEVGDRIVSVSLIKN